MSGKSLLFVIDQEINWLSIAEKAVYKVIARRCMSAKQCTYPAKEIAKQIGSSERTVRRAIEVLEACLAIEVERTPGKRWAIKLGELWESRNVYDLDLSQYDRRHFAKIVEIDSRRQHPTPDILSKTPDILTGVPRTFCPQTPDTMSAHKSIESSLKVVKSRSAFPSLHYASVNLVAYPTASKSTTCAPTGGF